MRIDLRSSRAVAGVFAALLWCGPGSQPAAAVESNDLIAFLQRAEKMSTPVEKIQADITIKEPDGTTRTAVLVIDPAGTAVFTQPSTGWKSVSSLAWKDGTVVEKTGAPERKLGIDEPLAGTDLRSIDFFPFWKTDYSSSLISDENTLEKTVSIYADKGQPYSLYVISFDKVKLIPRMIKFYKDTYNNLVRIRTDKDFVMVGSRPHPTQMLVRDFTTGTIRTYELKWSVVNGTATPAGKE